MTNMHEKFDRPEPVHAFLEVLSQPTALVRAVSATVLLHPLGINPVYTEVSIAGKTKVLFCIVPGFRDEAS